MLAISFDWEGFRGFPAFWRKVPSGFFLVALTLQAVRPAWRPRYKRIWVVRSFLWRLLRVFGFAFADAQIVGTGGLSSFSSLGLNFRFLLLLPIYPWSGFDGYHGYRNRTSVRSFGRAHYGCGRLKFRFCLSDELCSTHLSFSFHCLLSADKLLFIFSATFQAGMWRISLDDRPHTTSNNLHVTCSAFCFGVKFWVI